MGKKPAMAMAGVFLTALTLCGCESCCWGKKSWKETATPSLLSTNRSSTPAGWSNQPRSTTAAASNAPANGSPSAGAFDASAGARPMGASPGVVNGSGNPSTMPTAANPASGSGRPFDSSTMNGTPQQPPDAAFRSTAMPSIPTRGVEPTTPAATATPVFDPAPQFPSASAGPGLPQATGQVPPQVIPVSKESTSLPDQQAPVPPSVPVRTPGQNHDN